MRGLPAIPWPDPPADTSPRWPETLLSMAITSSVRTILAAVICLCCCSTISAQETATIGRSFAGSPGFLFDADGAVGPNHYAEITNIGFRVTALATGSVVYNSATLAQFWGTKVALPLLTGCCFDPQLEYDQATGRWFAVSLSGQSRTDSAVYLGISDTSDPSGAWKGLIIDADLSDLRWADLSFLGLDGSAVYITAGMPGIASTTPFRKAFFVLPKSDLTGAVPTAARLSRFLSQYPTTAPNDFHYDTSPVKDGLGTATDGLHIASFYQPTWVFTGSGYRWAVNAVSQRMTGQASGAATLLPWATTPSYLFDSTSNPSPSSPPADFGRQPGTGVRLNNGGGNDDVRIGDDVYSATSGYVRGRLGVVWRRFRPSTNTIVDAGFIGDDVNDYLSVSIAANANGDAVIAYARTSPTEYASFYFSAGRLDTSGKLIFGPPTLVKAGSDIYDENGPVKSAGVARFLDYASSVSVHPSDPSRFWISGPYVSARNIGSTWIAEIIMPDPPRFTTQPTNLTVTAGQHPQFTVAATGTPTPAYQWQLSVNNGVAWINLTDGGPYSGTSSANLVVAAAHALNGYQFRAVATNTAGSATSNAAVLTVSLRLKVLTDVDGDGKADFAVFRPSGGSWFMANSSTSYTTNTVRQWGLPGDVPVAGDYDGDHIADLAVYRPSNAVWYILQSSTNFTTSLAFQWGLPGDVPVPGDYDGDGKLDPAIYRPSSGVWYILTSSSHYDATVPMTVALGLSADIPVPADYDGDGTTDVAVYRPSIGMWHIRQSTSGGLTSVAFQWGLSGDVPVPGDYDGDRISDIAVYRPAFGMWFIRQSTTDFTTSVSVQWGLSADIAVPSDYDGDGKADLAVYRPSTGEWFIRQSTTAFATSVLFQWGLPGDIPIPNSPIAYAMSVAGSRGGASALANLARASDLDGDGRSDLTVYRPSNGTWFNLRSSTNYTTSTSFALGVSTDLPVTGDFDGDGKTDAGVYTPATGIWSILRSRLGSTTIQWGLSGDVPVPGDHDGDGKTDLAVYRPSNGIWYVLKSSTNFTAFVTFQWGLGGDVPVPGDYDGDGVSDLAVYRPSTGQWFIRQSTTAYATFVVVQWGLSGDTAVPGDYDGDGRTDLAVYRLSTSTWFILKSSTNLTTSVSFQLGLSSDTPVPGDYDGDGKTDVAVYRPSTGTWFVQKSSSNFTTSASYQWGLTGDIPILERR
jgi:FG-GAP-like repeat/Immunoglobulin I-set domain